MRSIAALFVGILLVSGCGADSGRVNVLVIVLDTTRADRCSITGYESETTPYLASLAREGVVYLDAWSPSNWTSPAHASLFTGLRPDNHGLLRGNREFLPSEYSTLAERLLAAGYRTACFTNNNSLAQTFGLAQGFQKFVPLYADDERDYPWAPETHRRALAWAIEQHRDGERFFLFVNDMEPHLPYSPPMDVARPFLRAGTDEEIIAWGETIRQRTVVEHILDVRRVTGRRMDYLSDLYDAEVRTLDDSLGILIDGLREEGILDDTVVVVAGDHGENLGDHGLMDHVFSLHRSLLHVPLLIRFPDRFPADTRVEDVVRLEDLMPTLLELCGLEVPPDLDGKSLLNEVGGRVARASAGPPVDFLRGMAESVELEFEPGHFRLGLRSVYDGRHHLIRRSDGVEEFYDVVADPGEIRNLVDRGGEDLERLRALLDEQ